MEEINISEMQRDALQEVANIGASHAATALSKLVQRDIKIMIPRVEVTSFEKITEAYRNEETIIAILLKISNEIPSYALLLLTRRSAFNLADILLQQKSEQNKIELTDIERSALEEVGNITMCAFFDSLAELLHIPIVPGPPALAYDIPSAVMDYIFIKIGEIADKIFVFDTVVQDEKDESFAISLLLVPEPKSINTILEKLGMLNM
ncbi:MAG: chemotaxis protein CheC [Candidatus Thermoplasmatota archaeon]